MLYSVLLFHSTSYLRYETFLVAVMPYLTKGRVCLYSQIETSLSEEMTWQEHGAADSHCIHIQQAEK